MCLVKVYYAFYATVALCLSLCAIVVLTQVRYKIISQGVGARHAVPLRRGSISHQRI
jgi:hypothetical protein